MGVMVYFRATGCQSYIEERRACGYLSAPLSPTKWWVFVDDDTITITPEGHYPQDKGIKKRTLSVSIADPQSLPKILAFINAKSKFLRGGTNHDRFVARDI